MDFDLVVEDQEVGLKRMRQGEVMACISAESRPVNGGAVMALGVLRYRALASPAFVDRYQTRTHPDRLSQIPCLIFNHDDLLQHQFLENQGLAPPQRIHRVPSSEGFVQMALAGLGFGMLPELQVKQHLDQGELIDVGPAYHLDVPLFWHYWQTESSAMTTLREAVGAHAAEVLLK